jgi:putative ABC transport system permease protein
MNVWRLALASLRDARLTQLLNVATLALGLGTLTMLLLIAGSVTDRLVRDAQGIDLVVGAKGSPLQLVLSTVFQVDNPTGNIPLAEVGTLAADPLIARAVPLALGDAAQGFRIVGTTPDYLSLYRAGFAVGQVWSEPMQAVLGATAARAMGLALGARFVGAHGVLGNGMSHSATPYTVTGILAPTGRVIDRLILTPVESVWKVHEGHGHAHAAGDGDSADAGGREVTAVLLQGRTPLAQIALPYRINRDTPFLAAVPAQEWARLLGVLGFGFAAFRAVGWALVASAALAMQLALLARLRERRQDWAVLRLLGASRTQVFMVILIEAMLLAAAGGVSGLVLGHSAGLLIATLAPVGSAVSVLDASLRRSEVVIPVTALLIGVVAAGVSILAAHRRDVAQDLVVSER